MKSSLLRSFLCLIALAVSTSPAATLKWSGIRNPCKISADDGVTNLGIKIGRFLPLENNEQWAHTIFNVNNRFSGSRSWVTVAVGEMPDATLPGPEEQDKFLARMGELGVDVYLELMPRRTNNVSEAIDKWLARFKYHPCVKGFGVDVEYYLRVTDEMAGAWDRRIKSHNPEYRMFLKHWEEGFMPPNYRGKGDIIFINTSSEASVEALNAEFARWAANFAPSACAFQIGYPADEDGMDGDREKGWWKLKDPIQDWGNSLVARIEHPTQEIGLLWVCVKSGKTYNNDWDLTKGAKLPATPNAAPAK